jgi:c-di-GMP-related signal transduction protein
MSELMKQIAVPQSVSNALCHQEGRLAEMIASVVTMSSSGGTRRRVESRLGLSDEEVVEAMRRRRSGLGRMRSVNASSRRAARREERDAG